MQLVPLFNIGLERIAFSLHGRQDYLNSNMSFFLSARSYNDKYDLWEPVIESVDGFVRYENIINGQFTSRFIYLLVVAAMNYKTCL